MINPQQVASTSGGTLGQGVTIQLDTGNRPLPPPPRWPFFQSPGLKGGLHVFEIEEAGISLVLNSSATNSAAKRLFNSRKVAPQNESDFHFLGVIVNPAIEDGGWRRNTGFEEKGWLAVVSTKELAPGITVANGPVGVNDMDLKQVQLQLPSRAYVYVGWYQVAGVGGHRTNYDSVEGSFVVRNWSFTGSYKIGGPPSHLHLSMKCFPIVKEALDVVAPPLRCANIKLMINIGNLITSAPQSSGIFVVPSTETFWRGIRARSVASSRRRNQLAEVPQVIKERRPVQIRIELKPTALQFPVANGFRFTEGDVLEASVILIPFQHYRNVNLEISLVQSLVCESHVDLLRRHVNSVIKRLLAHFNVSDSHRVMGPNGKVVAMHKVTFIIPPINGVADRHMNVLRVRSYKHELQIRCTQTRDRGNLLLASCSLPMLILSPDVLV